MAECLDDKIEAQNEACVRAYIRSALAGLEKVGADEMGYVPAHAAGAFHDAVATLKKAVELMDRKPEDISAAMAAKFVEYLAQDFDPSVMVTIAVRNAEETSRLVCHTHDFCDANDVMALAYTTVTGRASFMEDNEPECELWNAAWEIAKQRIEETYLPKA
jgi:hypothetical protein